MGRVIEADDPRVALEDFCRLDLTIVIAQVQAHWELRRLSLLIAGSKFAMDVLDRHALTGPIVAEENNSSTCCNRFENIIGRSDGWFARFRQCKRHVTDGRLQTAG